MAFRYSVRLSGAGGHGLIQAARILAEAAAVYDNKNAAESCSYGPEARGSASRAEIVISDEAIDYPRVESVDFFVALTQEAYDKYIKELKPSGILVTDSSVEVHGTIDGPKAYAAPIVEIAQKVCSQPAMVNIVALGFFAAVSGVISLDSIRQAILGRIPKMSEGIYLKAFESGLEAARQHREQTQ
jgi:2-oxoglutarate ferredoxin oxidoreductase subunit gamma